MLDKRLLDTKNVDLVFQMKRRASRLKVSWLTHQGSQKKRGNPTVQYLPGR